MSQEELTKLAVVGLIAELPEEQRTKAIECVDKMRKLLDEYKEIGVLAITLLGAELQFEASKAGF